MPADLGPFVAEGHRPVEYGRARLRVLGIGEEIPQPLELVAAPGRGRPEGRFELASLQDLERLGIEVDLVVDPLGNIVKVADREQSFVEPDLGVDGVGRRHPVEGRLDLAAVRSVAAPRGRVVAAAELDDLARGRVLDDLLALDKVGVAEADLPARGQPEELLGRVLHEILALDVQVAREGDLAASGGRILGVVDGVELLDPALGVVDKDDPERTQDGHHPGGGPVELLAQGVFDEDGVHDAVILGDADHVAEGPDRRRREAPPPESRDGRHARVVPAGDQTALDELEEPPFAEDGVAEVEPGEFDLLGMVDAEPVEVPVVEGAVDFELEGTDGMGDAFDRVAQAVGPVIGRVDAPGVARPVMAHATDPVHEGVAEEQVGIDHVDPGSERAGAVRKLAGPHPPEEFEVLLDRPAAEGAFLPGFADRSPVFPDLVDAEVADIGLALADEVLGIVVEPLVVIRGVKLAVLPVESQPADVLLDGFHVLDLFGLGVRIVEAEVAQAPVISGQPEVDANGLGVADVEVAVRFGRKARPDTPAEPVGQVVPVDNLADEIGLRLFRRFHGRLSSVGAGRSPSPGPPSSRTDPRPCSGR